MSRTHSLNSPKVVHMGETKGEWGFKAYKQVVKLQFKRGRYTEMMAAYREMLTFIKSAVTRNYSEKVINKLIDLISSSKHMELLQELYQTTLAALQLAQNERLWFKTNLKLGKVWYEHGEYGRLGRIIHELSNSCRHEDGTDDLKKGTQLLEVHALEIQLHTAQRNSKKLKQLTQKALQIKSDIPHPKITGLIRECSGKGHMQEREWELARIDFFEAFKSYDEAGVSRRVQCLKYLVLATMLQNSDINPFDSQEAKPYQNDPEIVAMTNLVSAYMRNEIRLFERVLKSNSRTIMGDDFIKAYIDDLLRNIRTQVLLKVIAPYTRIRISFIAGELNISDVEVEALLIALILDNYIDGHIDQLSQLLVLTDKADDAMKYAAVDAWSAQLLALQQMALNKM